MPVRIQGLTCLRITSKCAASAIEVLTRIDEDNGYFKHAVFSDEAAFYTREHKQNSPKENVWCSLMYDEVIRHFFC